MPGRGSRVSGWLYMQCRVCSTDGRQSFTVQCQYLRLCLCLCEARCLGRCPVPSARCPMPNARCPMPVATRPGRWRERGGGPAAICGTTLFRRLRHRPWPVAGPRPQLLLPYASGPSHTSVRWRDQGPARIASRSAKDRLHPLPAVLRGTIVLGRAPPVAWIRRIRKDTSDTRPDWLASGIPTTFPQYIAVSLLVEDALLEGRVNQQYFAERQ